MQQPPTTGQPSDLPSNDPTSSNSQKSKKRKRLVIILVILFIVLPMSTCGACITCIHCHNEREIETARAACESPRIFRLREGGNRYVPGDYECLSQEEIEAREQARRERAAAEERARQERAAAEERARRAREEEVERNRAAIEAMRRACEAPSVFRSKAGQPVELPSSWECAGEEAIKAEARAAAGPCGVFLDSPPLPAFSAKVIVETSAINVESGTPTIVGRTNLPDTTKLMLSVGRKSGGFFGQSKASVANGCLVAGPFSSKSAPLPPGEYSVQVSTPLPGLQPASVQAIIGDEGQNLRGPNVTTSKMFGKTKFVEVTNRFKMPGDSKSFDQQHRAKVRERDSKGRAIRRELQTLVTEGRSMPRCNGANCASQAQALIVERDCFTRMRALQPKQRALAQRAEEIDDRILVGAASSAALCITCVPTALDECRYAEESLRDWDEAMSE